MDKSYNIINNNFELQKENNIKYYPIYLRNNLAERENPLLMKEKFFNLKVYHTPNKIRENSNKKIIRNSLDVKDINFKENHLFKRDTNPLEPKYKYDWQMTEVNEDRKINYINFNNLGNYPKALYPYKFKKNLNLETYDIIGAQHDTKSPLSKIELRYGKKLHYVKDDIEGSHPGSLIRGIKTKRSTNPLDPDYPLIKGKIYEYGNERNNLKKRYDYKSLLDYYNKHSKISSISQDKERNNKFKIKNEITIDVNKLSRSKNFLDGFGKDKKIYPRGKYKNFRNDFLIYEKNHDYDLNF